jgi:hypothetical protein
MAEFDGSARRIEADNRIWRINLGKGRLSADSPADVRGKRKADLARGWPRSVRDIPDFPKNESVYDGPRCW